MSPEERTESQTDKMSNEPEPEPSESPFTDPEIETISEQDHSSQEEGHDDV